MGNFIIHDGDIILNRIVSESVLTMPDGQFCVEATGAWDGRIGQSVDTNGVIPDAPTLPTTEEQIKALQLIRDMALNSMVYNFGDGRVVQVRPQDRANLQDGIDLALTEWIMVDNKVYTVTTAELQVAIDSGMTQGLSIWLDCIAALKLL